MGVGRDADPAGYGLTVQAPLLLSMQQAHLDRAPQGGRQKGRERNDHTAKEAEGT